MAVCLEAHKALEMSVAGWSVVDIREEFGCSEQLAREYVSVGLAVIISYKALVKPSRH